jgi:tRNA(fMet)-specific endonuclease VapC
MAEVSRYLLDTTITIAIVRAGKLAVYLDSKFNIRSQTSRPLVSIVTIGELHAIALRRGWNKAKQAALLRIEEELVVVNINSPEIIKAYAECHCATEPVGKILSKNDLWIAATAKATASTLLTSDKDFDCLHPTHINRVFIDPIHGKP